MSEEHSPKEIFKAILKMTERKEYTSQEVLRDRVMITDVLKRQPKESYTMIKALLI